MNSTTQMSRPSLEQFIEENQYTLEVFHLQLLEIKSNITFESTCRFAYQYSF